MTCSCDEGYFLSQARQKIARIFPAAEAKHDCRYIEERNTLIPQAEEIADKKFDRKKRKYAWAFEFHRAMNRLWAGKQNALPR